MISAPGILSTWIVRRGKTITVTCLGELDIATEWSLLRAIEDALQSDATRVVVDLRPLRFTDTTALRVFDRARAKAREMGARLETLKGPAVVRIERVFGTQV